MHALSLQIIKILHAFIKTPLQYFYIIIYGNSKKVTNIEWMTGVRLTLHHLRNQ